MGSILYFSMNKKDKDETLNILTWVSMLLNKTCEIIEGLVFVLFCPLLDLTQSFLIISSSSLRFVKHVCVCVCVCELICFFFYFS